MKLFQSICRRLFKPVEGDDAVSAFDPTDQFKSDSDEPAKIAQRLNAAFLTLLAGQKHPDYRKAQALSQQTAQSMDGSEIARFYLDAVDGIHKEIKNVYYDTLDAVEEALKNKDPFALGLQQKAKAIIRECAVGKKQRV